MLFMCNDCYQNETMLCKFTVLLPLLKIMISKYHLIIQVPECMINDNDIGINLQTNY